MKVQSCSLHDNFSNFNIENFVHAVIFIFDFENAFYEELLNNVLNFFEKYWE